MVTDSENKSGMSDILGGILALYFISTQIMGIYFWWKMMKQDSFLAAILIDPFIAEFKGPLWPFFI